MYSVETRMGDRGDIKAVILSDSWFTNNRLKGHNIQVTNDELLINVFPHEIEGSCTIKGVNLSQGGLTLDEVINNRNNILTKWSNTNTNCTVLHAQTCGLVNKKVQLPKQGSVPGGYIREVEKVLDIILKFKEERTPAEEYETWRQNHRFVLYGLQDWGKFTDKEGLPRSA